MEFKLDNSIYKLAQLRRITFELGLLISKIEQNRITNDQYQEDQANFGLELNQLIELNNLDRNNISDLQKLKDFLEQIGNHPAVIHFSFNQEADPFTLQKLVSYAR